MTKLIKMIQILYSVVLNVTFIMGRVGMTSKMFRQHYLPHPAWLEKDHFTQDIVRSHNRNYRKPNSLIYFVFVLSYKIAHSMLENTIKPNREDKFIFATQK